MDSDVLSKDFLLLYDELVKNPNYQIKTILFKYKASARGNLQYLFKCIQQVFAINSSRLVLLNYNNFVVSKFPHKKKTKVVQIWHATGAIKRFGNETEHGYHIQNYDYAIANSDFYKKIYAKAFNIDEDKVLVTGIPNIDKLFNQAKMEELAKGLKNEYPQLIGKKVITYAPTFRGQVGKGWRELDIDLEKISEELGEDYIILYKPHPLIELPHNYNIKNIIPVKGEDMVALFSVTDILVTDYSAITLSWMTFKKPVIAFVPDLKEYGKMPGFFIDYEKEFPGAITYDEQGLIEAIHAEQVYQEKQAAFYQKTHQYTDGKSTQRVLAEIEKIMTAI